MLNDNKAKEIVRRYMRYKKMESEYEALVSLMNNVEINLQVETNLNENDFLKLQSYFHRYDFEIGKVNKILFDDLKLENNIKKLLEKKGMSIKELARKSDLTYSNTHKLVNREYLDNTYLDTLVKVAVALDVEIDELYTIK